MPPPPSLIYQNNVDPLKVKYLATAFFFLIFIASISTVLGKYFKVSANPYDQRFSARHTFVDFLKDHENNIYIWQNLFKKKWGFLLFLCVASITYAAMSYIWLAGSFYCSYYLIHFFFFYEGDQPYVIDLRDYVSKAEPTLIDCFKSINKIAKAAAFFKFYKLTEYFYIKKRPKFNPIEALQTTLISMLLGYNYWCLCIILDLSLVILETACGENLYIKIKLIITDYVHFKYSLHSNDSKGLRIYNFNGQWIFNPPKQLQLQLFNVTNAHSRGYFIEHTALTQFNHADKLQNAFIFTKNPTPHAESILIKSNSPCIKQQHLVTNGFFQTSQMTKILGRPAVLKNCCLQNAQELENLYRLGVLHNLQSTHTTLEVNNQIQCIPKSKLDLIINNEIPGYNFSDQSRSFAEALLTLKAKETDLLNKIYDQILNKPIDIKTMPLAHNLQKLLNISIEKYNFFDPN